MRSLPPVERRLRPDRARRLLGVAAVLASLLLVPVPSTAESRAGDAPAIHARGPGGSVSQEVVCAEPRPAGGGGTFRWYAQPGLGSVAETLSGNRALLRPLPAIGPVEAVLGDGRDGVAVYVLADLGCLDDVGLAGARPDWVAGVASLDGRFIALRADRARGDLETLPATFRHEVAHLALHEATAGNAPRWLQEGYAQWAAGSWDWQQAWRLRFVLFRGGGDFLRELRLGFPASEGEARVAYLLSYTAVQELAALAGPGGLAAFFARLREGADVDAALRSTFGLTADQFEERWRKRVEGRYGILYILSRATVFWVGVTLLLLWFGWRRKKRDREKMERLREEERLAEEWWGRVAAGWTPGAEGDRRAGPG